MVDPFGVAKRKTPPGNKLLELEKKAEKRQARGKNPSATPGQIAHALVEVLSPPKNPTLVGGKPVQGGPVFSPAGFGIDALLHAPKIVGHARETAVKVAHPSKKNPPSLGQNVEALLSGSFGLPLMSGKFVPKKGSTSTPRVAKGKTTPETGGELGKQVREGLRGAKKARTQQEGLYSEERGKRIAAAAKIASETEDAIEGHRLALRALKGDLPKIAYKGFQQFDESALRDAFRDINSHIALDKWQKVRARDSLARSVNDGKVPTRSEQLLLERVFGREMTSQLVESASFWKQTRDAGLSLINVPRALKSSFDLSAPFRQGLVLGARHPRMFVSEFKPMLKAARSEGGYDDLMNDIASRPTYPLMRESGLALTDLETIGTREEAFASNLAEGFPTGKHLVTRVPAGAYNKTVGTGVRASGRGYVGFLNRFRADAFDNYLRIATEPHLELHFEKGIPIVKLIARGETDPELLRGISSWVNHSTGRGGLGSLEGAAPALNALLFSPRLIASRLQLLNPVFYARLDPFARTQALRGMAQLIGGISMTLYLAKMAGAGVGIDPRSANFGKIKVGNTRIDIMGGFQQYIVLASRMIRRESVSSTTGEVEHLTGGFGKSSPGTLLSRFGQQKLAPVSAYGWGALSNENFAGQPFDPVKEAALLVTPLGPQNAVSTYQQEGTGPALAGLALGSIGFGVQTYGAKPKKSKRKNDQDPFSVSGKSRGGSTDPFNVAP